MSSSTVIAQLAQRLDQIRQTLPETVKLIAVTKQMPVEVVQAAYDLGIRDFGENRIQEATDKQNQLPKWSDVTWHLIGHLQMNKAVKAIERFDWIHSLDSLKLAQRLNQIAADRAMKPKVCLQVKILPDPNKFGWTLPDLWSALPALEQCQHLEIAGLMTILPYGLAETGTRAAFEQTYELAEQLRQQSSLPLAELSMGMSEDYSIAIQSGATMIRLGRVLFGERQSIGVEG